MKKTLLALTVVGISLAACSSPSAPENTTTTKSVQVIKHKHVHHRVQQRRTHSNT